MTITVRVRQFKVNPLLERKQFALEVEHPDQGTPSREQIRESLAKTYKVNDTKCILLYGFGTKFGGGRTRGYGLIYDNITAAKNYERRYRLLRSGIDVPAKTGPTRRAKKDIKNRCKKVRATEKKKVRSGGSK